MVSGPMSAGGVHRVAVLVQVDVEAGHLVGVGLLAGGFSFGCLPGEVCLPVGLGSIEGEIFEALDAPESLEFSTEDERFHVLDRVAATVGR